MRDMISVASGFQYSVNIGYDLGSDNKLKSFIPTKSALSLLEDILLSVNPTSSDRARVLIGAYGKGKSHIVLTILSILMKRDLTLFEKLMPKIEENPRLYQLIQNYYESENKILPLVISGSNTSLTQAFLLSLQRTLSEHDLLSAMPETNYKAAISVIKRWQKDFPETFEKFLNGIDDPVEVFITRHLRLEVLSIHFLDLTWLSSMRAWQKASSPRAIPVSMLSTTSLANSLRPISSMPRSVTQKCFRILRRNVAGAGRFSFT